MADELAKVKELIRRCLALSGSSNENEAAVAMAKAQELLYKYNLSENDIAAASGMAKPEVLEERMDLMGRFLWRRALVQAIARSNSCEVYTLHGKYYRDCIVLVGRSVNVAVTKDMVAWILPQVESWVGKASADWRGRASSRNSFRTSFAFGMISRIKDRLAEALQAEVTTRALVLDLRQEVATYMAAQNLKKGHGARITSGLAFVAGVAAGNNVSLRNRTRIDGGN